MFALSRQLGAAERADVFSISTVFLNICRCSLVSCVAIVLSSAPARRGLREMIVTNHRRDSLRMSVSLFYAPRTRYRRSLSVIESKVTDASLVLPVEDWMKASTTCNFVGHDGFSRALLLKNSGIPASFCRTQK